MLLVPRFRLTNQFFHSSLKFFERVQYRGKQFNTKWSGSMLYLISNTFSNKTNEKETKTNTSAFLVLNRATIVEEFS